MGCNLSLSRAALGSRANFLRGVCQHVFYSEAGLIEDALVFGHDPGEVCAKEHGGDFERELISVDVAGEVAGQAGLVEGALELGDP